MENNTTIDRWGLLKQKLLSLRDKVRFFWYSALYPKRKIIGSVLGLLFLTVSLGTGLYLVQTVQKTRVGATGAELMLSPSNANPKIGDEITIAVYLDTKGLQVSGADIKVGYDNNILEATSVRNGNFLPTVLVPGSISSGQASIVLGCLIDTTGVYPKSGTGILANITFKAKALGSTTVSFSSGTGIAAVGQSSNVAEVFKPVQITVQSSTGSPTPTSKACTQEAKLCSDGSYVGRTGPNCEFAPCPTTRPIPTVRPTPTPNPPTPTPTHHICLANGKSCSAGWQCCSWLCSSSGKCWGGSTPTPIPTPRH